MGSLTPTPAPHPSGWGVGGPGRGRSLGEARGGALSADLAGKSLSEMPGTPRIGGCCAQNLLQSLAGEAVHGETPQATSQQTPPGARKPPSSCAVPPAPSTDEV